jgi:predicted dehydrogenase
MVTEAKKVRVGVIGTGFGEKVVARAFNDTEGCEVVDALSPRHGSSVADLCGRRDVDVISIHSPPFMHLEHVRLAVQGGHAVLCDKPFGRNSEEAGAMCQLIEEAGVLGFLNFEMRYDPVRTRLRSLVQQGAIGDPEHVVINTHMSLSRRPLRPYGWLFDATLGGGWIGAWGSHIIDFLRWTLGELVDGTATRRTEIAERPDAQGALRACTAEDGFTAALRSASGTTVAIDSTFAASVNAPSRLSVFGSEGALEVTAEQETVHRKPDGSTETLEELAGSGVLKASMRAMTEAVRNAVRLGSVGPGTPTFDDGLACRTVMDWLIDPARAAI